MLQNFLSFSKLQIATLGFWFPNGKYPDDWNIVFLIFFCNICDSILHIQSQQNHTDRSGTGEVVPLVEGRVRTDRRCGGSFPLDDGTPSECDGSSANPCCSKWGYCGPGDDHCACETCVDYRTAADKSKDWEGTWRKDRRCGAEFPLPDGSGPTECNPESENFCCSKWGYCGGDGEHCGCPQCINYREKK